MPPAIPSRRRNLGDAMPAVVFVTAYDEYALRAFEVHALDYVLKPELPPTGPKTPHPEL